MRDADFQSLEAQGYTRETYKGLIIFTKDEPGRKYYSLKVYKDNAAHAILNYYYTDPDRRAERVQGMEDRVREFDNLQELEAAAKSGEPVSLLNMYNLVNGKEGKNV